MIKILCKETLDIENKYKKRLKRYLFFDLVRERRICLMYSNVMNKFKKKG